MELRTLFFDTYAFAETIEGNESYEKYRQCVIVTTRLNLMELHYGLLRLYGKEKADAYYGRLLPYTVDVSDGIIKKANELKLAFKKRKLSYVDCIGYTIAGLLHIPFLTGDRQFDDLENVEFVK